MVLRQPHLRRRPKKRDAPSCSSSLLAVRAEPPGPLSLELQNKDHRFFETGVLALIGAVLSVEPGQGAFKGGGGARGWCRGIFFEIF
jgi:hypothetical protein